MYPSSLFVAWCYVTVDLHYSSWKQFSLFSSWFCGVHNLIFDLHMPLLQNRRQHHSSTLVNNHKWNDSFDAFHVYCFRCCQFHTEWLNISFLFALSLLLSVYSENIITQELRALAWALELSSKVLEQGTLTLKLCSGIGTLVTIEILSVLVLNYY